MRTSIKYGLFEQALYHGGILYRKNSTLFKKKLLKSVILDIGLAAPDLILYFDNYSTTDPEVYTKLIKLLTVSKKNSTISSLIKYIKTYNDVCPTILFPINDYKLPPELNLKLIDFVTSGKPEENINAFDVYSTYYHCIATIYYNSLDINKISPYYFAHIIYTNGYSKLLWDILKDSDCVSTLISLPHFSINWYTRITKCFPDTLEALLLSIKLLLRIKNYETDCIYTNINHISINTNDINIFLGTTPPTTPPTPTTHINIGGPYDLYKIMMRKNSMVRSKISQKDWYVYPNPYYIRSPLQFDKTEIIDSDIYSHEIFIMPPKRYNTDVLQIYQNVQLYYPIDYPPAIITLIGPISLDTPEIIDFFNKAMILREQIFLIPQKYHIIKAFNTINHYNPKINNECYFIMIPIDNPSITSSSIIHSMFRYIIGASLNCPQVFESIDTTSTNCNDIFEHNIPLLYYRFKWLKILRKWRNRITENEYITRLDTLWNYLLSPV